MSLLRRRLMMAVQEGEAMKLERKELATLPREMNLKEILTEYPIPIKYRSCLVILSHTGKNIAVNGTRTRQKHLFFVSDGAPIGMASNYINELVSPDSLTGAVHAFGAVNSSYFSATNNAITANNLTLKTEYYAAGNTLYYAEIPYNYVTDDFDYTTF